MNRILPSDREWPLHGVARSRSIEAQALAEAPAHRLMQAAGEAIARLAMAIAPHARRVWIAAGPGNNGGDGLEAALHLAAHGRSVEIDLHADAARLPADARTSHERALATPGIRIRRASGAALFSALEPTDLAIDALLGLGGHRAPDEGIAATIGRLNALACPVLAVDLPSGLDADTGQPLDPKAVVVAQHTLSLLTLKPGLFTGAGRDHAGTVWWADLGVATGGEAPDAWLSASLPPAAPPRRHAQHKGSFGDLMVVGGATGMTGAGLLAARAGSAAGAGRVYLHLLQPADAHPLGHDLLHPELMFRGADLLDDAGPLGRGTVVCGCGGGNPVADLLPRLIDGAGRLVLDADALNALAADPALAERLAARGRSGRPTVITPHPLEAARLLGEPVGGVQADRLRAAARLAERHGCSVVLKGSGSIVAAPGRTPRINASGSAALASAGTGDVLAGWLGGLWAQQGGDATDGFETACRAVAEHGAAAGPDRAGSMRAGDLIEALRRRQR